MREIRLTLICPFLSIEFMELRIEEKIEMNKFYKFPRINFKYYKFSRIFFVFIH